MKKFLVMILLGAVSLLGDDVSDGLAFHKQKDYLNAFKSYEKACDDGNALGCSSLGFMYSYGQGVNQDYFKAAELYKKGCDGGDAMGCFSLGGMYANGKGVKQNIKIAKELFGKACDGQISDGCKNYKILNEQGF